MYNLFRSKILNKSLFFHYRRRVPNPFLVLVLVAVKRAMGELDEHVGHVLCDGAFFVSIQEEATGSPRTGGLQE